jgi:hypothetical protein
MNNIPPMSRIHTQLLLRNSNIVCLLHDQDPGAGCARFLHLLASAVLVESRCG